MIRRARLRLAALSAAGLVIAGACGGDSDNRPTTAGAVSATTTTTAAPAPVTPTTAEAPATSTITAAPVTTTATTTPGVAPGAIASAASPPAPAPSPPAPAPAPAKVEIAAFAFGPSPVLIRAGQTVTWTNTDDAAHSIQDTSRLATPVSPSLAKGDSFSITYPRSGTYSYTCGIHPSMEGSVEVAR